MNRLLLLFILFFTSCNLISRKSYGVKKQKTETPERIKDWLAKYHFNAESVFALTPENYVDYTISTQTAPLLFEINNGRLVALGFTNGIFSPQQPDRLFATILPYSLLKNKPDSFLVNKATSIPPGASIRDKHKYITNYDTTFLTIKNAFLLFRTLTGEKITEPSQQTMDYILVIPFAIYLGDKEQLKRINNYYYSALNNRFSKISIVFLNLDKQSWWDENWNSTNTMKYQ